MKKKRMESMLAHIILIVAVGLVVTVPLLLAGKQYVDGDIKEIIPPRANEIIVPEQPVPTVGTTRTPEEDAVLQMWMMLLPIFVSISVSFVLYAQHAKERKKFDKEFMAQNE